MCETFPDKKEKAVYGSTNIRREYSFSLHSDVRTTSPERATQKDNWLKAATNEDLNSTHIQFGELSHKNTWSRTYRKIFRQFLEDERPIDYEEIRREESLNIAADALPPNDPFSHTLHTNDNLPEIPIHSRNKQQQVNTIEIQFEKEVPFVGNRNSFSNSQHSCGSSTRNITRNLTFHDKHYAEIEHCGPHKGGRAVVAGEAVHAEPSVPPTPPPPPPPVLPPVMRVSSGNKGADFDSTNFSKSTKQSISHAERWIGQSKSDPKHCQISYGTTISGSERQCSRSRNSSQGSQMSSFVQLKTRTAHNDGSEFREHLERVREDGDIIHERLHTVTFPVETPEWKINKHSEAEAGRNDIPHFLQSSYDLVQPVDANARQSGSVTPISVQEALQDQTEAKDSMEYCHSYADHELGSNTRSYGRTKAAREGQFNPTPEQCIASSQHQLVEATNFKSHSPSQSLVLPPKQMLSKPTQTDRVKTGTLLRKQSYPGGHYSTQQKEHGVIELVKMFEKGDENPNIMKISQTHAKVNSQLSNFVGSYFGNTRPVAMKAVEEIDIPLQHYWSMKARMESSEKHANVTLEQLLTFVPGHQRQQRVSFQEAFIPSHSLEHCETDYHIQSNIAAQRQAFDCSSTREVNENMQWTSPVNNALSSESDLLAIHEQIKRNLPLDWSELHTLKKAHCRLVIPRENQLRKLKRESTIVAKDGSTSYANHGALIERMEAELLDDYKNYQQILDSIRVVNHPYTQLAFLIMQADAAWYTAKVTKDAVSRRHQYSLAKRHYSELLEKGTAALAPNDPSLLKILEKLSAILAEYPDQQDRHLKNKCWQTLRDAKRVRMTNSLDEQTALMLENTNEMLECCDFFY